MEYTLCVRRWNTEGRRLLACHLMERMSAYITRIKDNTT